MDWSIICSECNERTEEWIMIHTSRGVKLVCMKCLCNIMKEYENNNKGQL